MHTLRAKNVFCLTASRPLLTLKFNCCAHGQCCFEGMSFSVLFFPLPPALSLSLPRCCRHAFFLLPLPPRGAVEAAVSFDFFCKPNGRGCPLAAKAHSLPRTAAQRRRERKRERGQVFRPNYTCSSFVLSWLELPQGGQRERERDTAKKEGED
jgi:hypothetical protein